jgi:peroxiredoxin
MLKLITSFFLAGILLVSCTQKGNRSSASISGSVPELAGKWIFLEELEVKRLVTIDSSRADGKGNFSFNIGLTSPAFFILRSDGDQQVSLLLDKNERAEIHCDQKLFSTGCNVTGSAGSQLLFSFEEFMLQQKQRIDSLAEVFYAFEGTPEFQKKKLELDSLYAVIMENQRNYVFGFIEKNKGSLASLLVLNRKLGNNKVLDEEEDYIYFHRVDSALSILYPDNKHVLDHHNRVKEIQGRKFDRFTADEKLKPGKKAPNIVVRDTSNQPKALKSLLGKKVLICFWAGWNAKSRQDNRKLVRIYDKLSKKNIEVFGVSLDENEIIWKGAVKLDGLPGIQGSDLKGLNSEVMKDYNLPEILPFYYFIDEEGKIIYRNKDFNELIRQIEL